MRAASGTLNREDDVDVGIREAAGLLRVPEETVYRWIEERGLPVCRVNGRCHFSREDLLEWAMLNRVRVSSQVLRPALRESPFLVSEAISAGGIFHGVAGATREEALRSVVRLLRLPGDVDREMLLDVLLAREALGSTGVGDGIAVPHPRHPIVLGAGAPTVTVCFLEKPVDFGALDGLPVYVLFTLMSPTVRSHVATLSGLSFLLHDATFGHALETRAAADRLLDAARNVEAGLASRRG